MHLIWLSLVLPAMFLIPWAAKSTRRPLIWVITFSVAIVAILIWSGINVASYLTSGGGRSDEIGMRLIYAVMTLIEIPLVALTVGSVINWLACKRFWNREPLPQSEVIASEPTGSVQLESS